eukprot:4317291-Amphidinium_carterae.1
MDVPDCTIEVLPIPNGSLGDAGHAFVSLFATGRARNVLRELLAHSYGEVEDILSFEQPYLQVRHRRHLQVRHRRQDWVAEVRFCDRDAARRAVSSGGFWLYDPWQRKDRRVRM